MSDTVLKNAEAMRDSLAAKINRAQAEIDGWQRELRRVDLFIQDWHTIAAGQHLAPGETATIDYGDEKPIVLIGRTTAERAARRYNSPKEDVAAAARRVIEAHGEPMSRTDLYRELVSEGLKIDGKNPEMVLSTMLWRMGDAVRVVRLKTGGYWLKERPWEPAGYVPVRTTAEMREDLDKLVRGIDQGAADVRDKFPHLANLFEPRKDE